MGIFEAIMAIAAAVGAGTSVYAATRKAPQPKPQAPVPEPQTGGDTFDAFERLRKRRGRASTLLTGDLIPTELAEKTLLG